MTKFRIIESINSHDGTSEWFVQEKHMFIWWHIDNKWTEEAYNFETYEKAKEYINAQLKIQAPRIREVKEEC